MRLCKSFLLQAVPIPRPPNPLPNPKEAESANKIFEKINQLDQSADLQLSKKFFLVRLLTKIRQIFNFIFDRQAHLAKTANKIKEDLALLTRPPVRDEDEDVDDKPPRKSSPVVDDIQPIVDHGYSTPESSSEEPDDRGMITSESSSDEESADGFRTPESVPDAEQRIMQWLDEHLKDENLDEQKNAFLDLKASQPQSSEIFDSKIGSFETIGYDNMQFLKNLDEDSSLTITAEGGKLKLAEANEQNADELVDVLASMAQTSYEEAELNIDRQRNAYATVEQLEKALYDETKILQWARIVHAGGSFTPELSSKLSSLIQITEQNLRRHFAALDALMQVIHAPDVAPVQNELPSIEKAQSELEAFCNLWCPGMSEDKARELINKGRELYLAIQQGKAQGTEDDLLNLTWFLMYKSIQKKQGYEEGTFVIEDPEQKVYKFLLASTGEKGNKVYSRKSTHYVGRSPSSHFGLDIFRPEMPAQKRTLLFAMVKNHGSNEEVLFIKPENYSAKLTYFLEALWHGGEMLIAQRNKLFYPGMDDQENMRKERIPVDVADRFAELVDKAPNKKAILAEAKKYGIAYMLAFVKNPVNNIPPNSLDDIIPADRFDHLDKRTGREVYLDVAELQLNF